MDIFQKIMTFISPPNVGAGPQKQSTIVTYIKESELDTQFALIKLVSMSLVKRADDSADPLWALTTEGRQGMGSLTLDMSIGPPPVEADEYVKVVDPNADVPVTYVKKEKPAKEVSPLVKDFHEWRETRQLSQDALKVSEKLFERRSRSRGNTERQSDKMDAPAKQPKPKNKPKTGR